MIRKSEPSLSVVIPTRERYETLRHALRTVVEQDSDRLQIIVSDNHSADLTRETVESFRDDRITYVRTASRVSMARNWEHGLAQVEGDYVMFLGDDDGLLPHAIEDISTLLATANTAALIWRKPDYNWPASGFPSGLAIGPEQDLWRMDGSMILSLVASGRTSYGRLPILYSGFVRTAHVDAVKLRSGRFFRSATPDVYSGIALLSEFTEYLYSLRGFSLNGCGGMSNGAASRVPGSQTASLFFSEMDIPQHTQMKILAGSIESAVAEALFQANDHCFNGELRINLDRILQMIISDLDQCETTIRSAGLEALSGLPLSPKQHALVDQAQRSSESVGTAASLDLAVRGPNYADAPMLGITNVYDACRHVGSAYGRYRQPMARPFSWRQALALKAKRRLGGWWS